MRRVGETEAGNVLVELAPGEWSAIKHMASPHCGSAGPGSLYVWEADFRRQLEQLDLSNRLFNTLSRALRVDNRVRAYNNDTGEYDETTVAPYIVTPLAFMRGDRPMSFDEWLTAVAAGHLDSTASGSISRQTGNG